MTSLELILSRRVFAALFTLCVSLVADGRAATFIDDLSATNGGSETVTSTRWLAGQFTTDSSSYSSLSATLLMSQVSAGTAQLDLYSDTALLTPTSLIATFTSPASFSTSSLANATFTASGLSLTPNTNYWLVLHAPTGSYNWGWTSDFTVMQAWADSSDSGGVWFAGDAFPPQFSISSSVVPEPAALSLFIFGLTAAVIRRRHRAR